MKIQIWIVKAVIIVASVAICPLNGDPIQDINKSMSGSNPLTRATAMQDFVISLGTVKGQSYMTRAIPVLTTGLSDSDVDVRRNAASGLLMIAAVTAPVIRRAVPNQPSPFVEQPIQQALLKATSDVDEVVRLSAIKAFAISNTANSALEDKIIQEFNAPVSNINDPSEKVAMIECLLMNRSPSPKAQIFLSDLLNDPKYGVQVAERMGADNCALSVSTLSKLVTKLGQENDPVHQAAYARAIGAYGKQAQQYKPQLLAALANQKDVVAKQNLARTIARIQ